MSEADATMTVNTFTDRVKTHVQIPFTLLKPDNGCDSKITIHFKSDRLSMPIFLPEGMNRYQLPS